MRIAKVKADEIPQRQRERPGQPLLKIVRKAFEDPKICKEFQNWQQARIKQKETLT